MKDRIAELREGLRQQAPAEALAIFDGDAERLAASDLEQAVLPVGAHAPEFALADVDGETVRLEALRARGPVLVTFYRGAWCPYCSVQLRTYQEIAGALEAAGVTLIAISPQQPDGSLSMKEKEQLSFHVLSDPGNDVARAYGLVFSLAEHVRETALAIGTDLPAVNGDDSWELPMPATFLLDSDGTIAWREAHADYRHRAEPTTILAAVRELSTAALVGP